MHDLLTDWRFHQFQHEISNLLSFAERPERMEPLSVGWASDMGKNIRESAWQATQAAGDNIELREKVNAARVLANQFIGAMTDNMSLSAIPVDAWTLPTRRKLYLDLAAYREEFKLLIPPSEYAASQTGGTDADEPTESKPDARHSPDFASVNWFGTLHVFSTNQAACVRVLWEAWENRTPILAESTIQDAAGVESELRHVFRNHPAWNTMIVSPSKGRYRLADHIS